MSALRIGTTFLDWTAYFLTFMLLAYLVLTADFLTDKISSGLKLFLSTIKQALSQFVRVVLDEARHLSERFSTSTCLLHRFLAFHAFICVASLTALMLPTRQEALTLA